jgi:hypothetical protein
MKNVWIAFEGAMINALPRGNESRLSNPFRRDAESNAVISWSATILPFLTFAIV